MKYQIELSGDERDDKKLEELYEKEISQWNEKLNLWIGIRQFLNIDNIHFRCTWCNKRMFRNSAFCSEKCHNDWVPF
jgi:hypothetical protein